MKTIKLIKFLLWIAASGVGAACAFQFVMACADMSVLARMHKLDEGEVVPDLLFNVAMFWDWRLSFQGGRLLHCPPF